MPINPISRVTVLITIAQIAWACYQPFKNHQKNQPEQEVNKTHSNTLVERNKGTPDSQR
jgi:hypothetical protein